jgi:tetratricopeptide (TPR) repeat protein
MGQFDRARAVAQTALHLAHSLGFPESIAHALLRWAEAHWYQGQIEAARPLLEQVLSITDRTSVFELELQEFRSDALCLQGSTAVRLGHYDAAIASYEESLHISRALEDTYRESRAVHSLGTALRNQGKYHEAQQYLEQGLQLSRRLGDCHSESRSLNSLGDIAYYLGDYLAARRHYRRVYDLALELGDHRSESIAMTNLGIVARDLGQSAQAEALLQQGLQVAQTIGFRRGEAWARVCLSLLFHQIQQDAVALALGEQGLRTFEELGDLVGQAYAWTEVGHALLGLRRLAGAAAAYEQAWQLRRQLAQPHLAIEALAGLIRVDLAQGAQAEAARRAEQLAADLERTGALGTEEPAQVYWSCYQALQPQARAQAILAAAHQMLQERAALIDEESLRHSFLTQVPLHHAIAQAWSACCAGVPVAMR